jgi:lipid-binding SYLF domain-containing protein
MKTFQQYALIAIVSLVTLFSSVLFTQAENFTKPDELVLKSEAVFKSFMTDPNMGWFRENIGRAKAVFIVPQMLRGGLFIGGSGGSGALLAQEYTTGKWSYPAFYTMGAVSFGLQIGADSSEIILMIMTNKGMEAMLSTEFKLGGDIALAAGPVGASAKAQTADVLAYGRSKGAFTGITVEGAVIKPRYEWNNSYYGKEVRLVDIIINQAVSNPQADALRAVLPVRMPNTKPLGSN